MKRRWWLIAVGLGWLWPAGLYALPKPTIDKQQRVTVVRLPSRQDDEGEELAPSKCVITREPTAEQKAEYLRKHYLEGLEDIAERHVELARYHRWLERLK